MPKPPRTGRYQERHIWIPVSALEIGMFVCALDRPWLETPFPLQGVMVSSRRDIETLSLYCDRVQIDVYKCWINVKELLLSKKEPASQLSRKFIRRFQQNQNSEADERTEVGLQTEMVEAKRIYSESAIVLNQVMEDVKRGKSLDFITVQAISLEMVQSILRNPDALIWLSQLRNKDDYAYQHAINVCILMLALGKKLALSTSQLTQLGMAGLLQDIGVLRIPREILYKRGKLSPEEIELVQSHVNKTLALLHNQPNIPLATLETIAQHHERYDGSGYPKGLKAHQISLFGSMAGIADCFDAMVSERPYAPALSPFQALMFLYNQRDQAFNAAVVERFIQTIGIYPIGSIVELNSGEVAIVVEQRKERRLKPKLLVILDADKKFYQDKFVLDLLDDPETADGKPYLIKDVLEAGAYGIDPKEYFLL